jgi:hypothetical protein
MQSPDQRIARASTGEALGAEPVLEVNALKT